MKKILNIALSILIAEAAGIIGSFFTISSVNGWYQTINKPSFNPPAWIFSPVWLTLYALMGLAAYLVWSKGWQKKEVKFALGIYLAQLILNSLWSIVFFGLHEPGWALVNLVVLWLLIVATIISFAKVSKPAAWLLLPYILWVSFAAVLNYYLFILN